MNSCNLQAGSIETATFGGSKKENGGNPASTGDSGILWKAESVSSQMELDPVSIAPQGGGVLVEEGPGIRISQHIEALLQPGDQLLPRRAMKRRFRKPNPVWDVYGTLLLDVFDW